MAKMGQIMTNLAKMSEPKWVKKSHRRSKLNKQNTKENGPKWAKLNSNLAREILKRRKWAEILVQWTKKGYSLGHRPKEVNMQIKKA
jgi:hypothetical protein|mmetsp:Transcript_75944/g.127646  ORF Transcript_75944/g.127646 Transcript_75944/m.127646 type:complete len:87 (-) Transcript_75944:228-488(-)|eukprot:CAMPEP_0174296534 /NCGR_PEP_ID=MMETSP0809-20121228/48156_1 /TAXON_ID=73025 ORGANISM="Eutreptiella gymnastica-like, Strain CCMP1594" /NCGR_SAMPLE_ID=MMETSP0809 /ASSEMBLY_ACC=CAM_ASM_000658 /LENGTH=86 /DNA_ID=CAMNT_0015399601 /DNA_START=71 /DNA_END=331 /DNA_ORIENTATION=-